jgi:hypothetical protein
MLTKMNPSGGNYVSDGIRFNIANDRDLMIENKLGFLLLTITERLNVTSAHYQTNLWFKRLLRPRLSNYSEPKFSRKRTSRTE